MKKISVKQLLVNAMEDYGNNLILAERFWSQHYRPNCGRNSRNNIPKLTYGGILIWRWKNWFVQCRRSARCAASAASDPANQMTKRGLSTVRRPNPTQYVLGGAWNDHDEEPVQGYGCLRRDADQDRRLNHKDQIWNLFPAEWPVATVFLKNNSKKLPVQKRRQLFAVVWVGFRQRKGEDATILPQYSSCFFD